MNSINIIGYAVDKPTLNTKDDVAVCNFVIACNTFISKDKEEVLFIKCTLFGARANAAYRAINKGSRLFVNGRLKCYTYEDVEKGEKRTIYSIVLANIEFLDDKTLERLKEKEEVEVKRDWY